MMGKTGAVLLFALTLLGLAATGYWMLFSYFPGYDDEGYILLSTRAYHAHGGLYDLVYSQYGPAFYFFGDIFQSLLGSPVNHTSARLLTLALWLGTAGACAGLVRQQTGTRSLPLFTFAGTFLYLHFVPGEPFHPGTWIIFILALSLWILTTLISADRWATAAVVAGATGAILLLTKINVGVFYVVAVGAWTLLQAVPDRARRTTAILVGLALVAFAAALMNALWRETWIQVYLALFVVATIGLMSALRGESATKLKHAGFFAVAGGSVALVILALIWLRGTSVAGLLEGVLLAPLRHPSSYSFAVNWRAGSLLAAGSSLLVLLVLTWIRRRLPIATANAVVVALRLALAAALLTGLALLINFRVIGAVFSFMAPLIWVWVIPLEGVALPSTARLSRGLIATVLLLQFLHAYPVGGSQESWGSFLFIPLVALGLDEVRRWDLARKTDPALASRRWLAFTTIIVAVLTVKVAWTERSTHRNYAAFSELGLPGTGQLRLPEPTRTAYRILSLNAAVHADLLFSLPGMYSFNLWTGLPTPTGKNATLWFTLLSDGEQCAIIEAIDRSRRPCIIVQESLIAMMQEARVPIQGVLRDYLFREFLPVFNVEGFVFLVRKGRVIAPLNIAQLSSLPQSAAAAHDTQLDFRLASDGTPIAGIEARDLVDPPSSSLILDGVNAQVTAFPIDSFDHMTGPPANAPWPLRVRGLVHFSVRFNRASAGLLPSTTAFYLKGIDGKTLGEARISE